LDAEEVRSLVDQVAAVVAGGWVVLALALGWVMGRRGFEAYTWTFVGLVLGPIAVAIALAMVIQPPAHEPKLLRRAMSRGGVVDVLVGADGSPEAQAAVAAASDLLDGRIGRLTFARVVPIDAPRNVVRDAEASLEHQRLLAGPDASSVLLRGLPADALRDYAARLDYELIAIGTRGEGRSHALLGSVASTLARGSVIPVLLSDAVPSPTGRPTVVGHDAAPDSDTKEVVRGHGPQGRFLRRLGRIKAFGYHGSGSRRLYATVASVVLVHVAQHIGGDAALP
jgi:nucleotide-binding universal stress UspA family protein